VKCASREFCSINQYRTPTTDTLVSSTPTTGSRWADLLRRLLI
jgi:hypothetical protein